MTAASPPEAFPIAPEQRAKLPAPPVGIRLGNGAMVAGTASLVLGVVIDLAGGVLAANAPWLHLTLAPLDGPLIACGQVFLIGGAIAARLARRRMLREAAKVSNLHTDAR